MTQDRICYIYGLRHPGENTIMYVGKTVNPFARLYGHIFDLNGDSSTNKKIPWIIAMLEDHCYPVMDIIDVCHQSDSVQREWFWICYYKQKNPNLTNTIGKMQHKRWLDFFEKEGMPITVADLFTITTSDNISTSDIAALTIDPADFPPGAKE